MATFRRSVVPGATYFFTVNTKQRIKVLTNAPFYLALKNALRQVNAQHSFTIDAFVLLPDHLHVSGHYKAFFPPVERRERTETATVRWPLSFYLY